jgi:glycosyltransferase involved in cell wall biosynthesis
LRTLFYGLSLGPPWVEGLRNTVRSLSSRLAARGFDVTVLSRGAEDTVLGGVRYLGLKVGGDAYSENAPRVLTVTAGWLRSHGRSFDVVHGHSSFPLVALPALFAGRSSVFTLYSPVGAGGHLMGDSTVARRVALRFSKSALPVAATSPFVRFVATSDAVRASLPTWVRRHARTIPVGVEFERFNRRVDTAYLAGELGLACDRYVLFAGDVTPWKGGEDFLVAASLVLREEKRVGFLFLTKGTYEYEEERLRRLHRLAERLDLTANLRFLGRRPDMNAVYQFSDVVVLPYRSMFSFMSTPLSLLEAMSAARPIVATRVGDMPSILRDGENGMLCDPGDTATLASKILLLLRDPRWARSLGYAAADNARQYDWDNVVDRYVCLYNEL